MQRELSSRFVDEISKKVVGRTDVVRLMIVALVSQGHILLEGNPGLGKTTLAKAFSETIGGDFNRIQMTPDTLPADILGTYVFDQRDAKFELRKGPIFGNVILVDELNRATPKAQAALLEAMQERQVSLEGETMKLVEPFMVLATQVPFGAAGTYPLSEVQADRFAFSVLMGYPSAEDEMKVIGTIDAIEAKECQEVITPQQVVRSTAEARTVFVSDAVKRYIISLVGHVRESSFLRIPPSTRASIALLKGARALALLDARDHVLPDDIKFLAPFVFYHRVFLTAEAMSEDATASGIIKEALEKTPVPKE